MGKRLIIKQRAYNSIERIAKNIFEEGYPERARSFATELINFAQELTNTSDSFAFCRHKQFAKKEFKCIPYRKNYIFIISVKNDVVIIHNITIAKKIR